MLFGYTNEAQIVYGKGGRLGGPNSKQYMLVMIKNLEECPDETA
ncbi:hypothetical protein M8C21_010416, partial [Ambrosia artemisiifolia]